MKNSILVFIDSGVNYYQQLFDGVVAEAKPFILDTVSNGIQQIDQILQQYPGQKTVHIISHGAPGCLYLGNTELSLDTLKQYAPLLQHWDIENLLLYGCHVASGDAGEEFVSKLQNLTGANIAASKSLTGAAVKGGNWDLEVNTGKVNIPPALQIEVMETYSGIFNLKQENTFASERVIVKLKENAKVSSLNRLQAKLGVTKVNTINTDIGIELWNISGDVEDFIRENEDNHIIEYIQPDYILSANSTVPNDTSFDRLWGLNNTGQTGGISDADIDAPEAWDIQTGSNDIIVGVIDTGIDYTHPDLVNNMWINPGEIAGDGIDNDNNGYVDDIYGYDFAYNDSDPDDVDGHGTHVAGTIGAEANNGQGIAGVSWNVKLMALKFLDDTGSGYTSDAIKAIQYATEMGADITNNSWGGGGYSQGLYDAIAAAGAADSLFIAAAGNDYGNNNDSSPSYPASYDLDNIISVASTDRNDNLSNFSNIGPTSVDLGAPGSSIYSTVPGGGYGYKSGTSMATPHVSGVAALVLAENPDLTYQEVKEIILENTDEISALNGKTLTGGRLNAFKALSSLSTSPIDITLTNDTIDENEPDNTVVGILGTNDLDNGDFTYELVSGDGDTDNIAFTINDNDELIINSSPDFEEQSSYNIRIEATDTDGETYENKFTISIEDINEEPTDIELDNNSINENVPADTVVGTFSTIDPDVEDTEDTFSYQLVAGDGDTDNGAFTIDSDSNELKINSSPNFEAQSSYSIRVETTDQGGETYEEEFTINVEDINEEPTDIELDNNSINENVPADTVVGTFSTVDPDVEDTEDTFSYQLVAGDGDTDNGAFTIDSDSNELKINSSPNFEAQSSYSIRVETTDQGGETYEEEFTINVNPVESEPVRFDFNGDGIADIFWRNGRNGKNRIWLMNDDGTLNQNVNSKRIGKAWDVAGVDDFNGDGIADILWRNGRNGKNRIWLMNDDGTLNQNVNSKRIGKAWDVAGVDDFNADGVPDILWRNGKNGKNRIWLMNDDGTFNQNVNIETLDKVWDVAGVDDFNADGVPDILWRNGSNGDNSIWLMNDDGTLYDSLDIEGKDTAFDVAGVDDFNVDGVPDILWRNGSNGDNSIWLMNDDGTLYDSPDIEPEDTDWDVAGVVDFNTDGVADILWRNGTDGTNNIWLMNEDGTRNSIVDPGTIGTNWDVAGM